MTRHGLEMICSQPRGDISSTLFEWTLTIASGTKAPQVLKGTATLDGTTALIVSGKYLWS
jgi:hypothetical protein